MRFRLLARQLGCLATLLFVASAVHAQSGFYLREIKLTGEQFNNNYEAFQYFNDPASLEWQDFIGQVVLDDFSVEDYVNTGQDNTGNWQDRDPEFSPEIPPLEGGDDYAIEARAMVSIPAGSWQISFGRDDGGQLTLQTQTGSDIHFSQMFGTNGQGNYRLRGRQDNSMWFLGTGGHNWTGGVFTVAENTTALLNANFFERGGGDSYEIAIRDASDGNFDTAPQPSTWTLLEDGALGWGVTSTEEQVALQANQMPAGNGAGGRNSLGGVGDGLQNEIVPTSGVILGFADAGGGDPQPGLAAEWYNENNAGNLSANLAAMLNTPADQRVAYQDDETWWAGNAGPTPDGFRNYPEAIADSDVFGDDVSDGNIDSYIAAHVGEIEFPAGVTRLRYAVDDYKYLAVDVNGNGVAGDSAEEVLLDDNTWVNWNGTRANTNEPVVTGVDMAEAGWKTVVAIMADGGGGDSGMLYWDANDTDADFPNIAPLDNDLILDDGSIPEDFLVPADKMRAVPQGTLESVALKAGFADTDVNLDISSDLYDSDNVVLTDPNFDTEIDLTGAAININIDGGPLQPGDEWILFFADEITGAADAEWNYPNEGPWTNQLVDGTGNRIIFGGADIPGDCNGDGTIDAADLDCVSNIVERDIVLAVLNTLPGDLDGDGEVAFDDFLTLSGNFNLIDKQKYTDGDIDLQFGPQFADFLILSGNFGQTPPAGATAAAVPEPSSLALLGLGGLLIGLVRRRRS